MIQKIHKTKLHEVVIKQIVEMISLGMYKPGDKLPSEKQLCSSFGVSRVTMREALKELAALEFIETKQGSGSIVTVSADDPRISAQFFSSVASMENNFRYTMEARLLVEPMLVHTLALTATDAELKELEQKMIPVIESDDPSPFYLEDCHLFFADVLHNPLIYDFLALLRQLENDAPSRHPTLPEHNANFRRTNKQHYIQILNSIVHRQPDMAYLYMKEHILYLRNSFESFFSLL